MPKNRIESAQAAYSNKDIEESKKAHTKESIEQASEEHRKAKGKYIGDFVYGALDGIVTTFAVVSGVEGAKLSSSIVLILGFANLFADGVSMAVGKYLSSKSEIEYIRKERERESWEIDNVPEGEIHEVREIYRKKGFKGKELESAVKTITSDRKVWIDTMMQDELGLYEEDKTPVMSGLATLFAFITAGFVPLLAFVVSLAIPGLLMNTFLISVALTGVTLFTVGAMRSWVTGIKWHRSGFEMLFVGGIAACVAYIIGYLLRSIA